MKLLNRSRLALIALLLVLSTLFASCDFLSSFTETTLQETTKVPTVTETTTAPLDDQETPVEPFDYNKVPAFTNKHYVEINGNVPYFTKKDYTTTSYESYSELDSLGRCGVAMACVGKDLMPTKGRGDIGHIKPSGWVQATYDGTTLYNRSHLLAHQLTGEDDNEKNLITGTAYFNQGGMYGFENMVADYIKETNNHVLYRVTPIFIDDELVARGVLMEAYSVEDDGDGVCFNVFVYNVQIGIEIDYKTGKSQLSNDPNYPGVPGEQFYILNINPKSMKIHLPTCSSVAQMSESNKQEFHGTLEEAKAMGYSACGTCKPK